MEDIQFNFEDENAFEIGNDHADEDELELTSKAKKGKKKKLGIKKATFRPAIAKSKPPPVQESYTPRPVFNDRTFESFSNPQKRMPQPESEPSENSLKENEEFNEDNASEENQSLPAFGEDDVDINEIQPSEGYDTIEDEKQDLLYKFHRLESRGIKVSKKFNMYSDVREMRSEFFKIKKDSEVNSSVKFSRRMLMAFVSASEFLNKRYDPFSMELNGWSETVMENVNDGDYDNVFERLHDKYAGKVNTPPEIELMLSLAGSAVMFHMTSSMFKSVPNIGEMAKQNPDIQKAMKSMADSLMKAQMTGKGNENESNQESDDEIQQFNNDGRREMKGPSMDLSTFGNILPHPMPSRNEMPVNHQPPRTQPPPEIQDDQLSISDSEQSGINVKSVSLAVSEGGTRRGRKPKITATKENTIDI